jgi:hypothetical protein
MAAREPQEAFGKEPLEGQSLRHSCRRSSLAACHSCARVRLLRGEGWKMPPFAPFPFFSVSVVTAGDGVSYRRRPGCALLCTNNGVLRTQRH